MNIILTSNRTFSFAAVFAYFGGVSFWYTMTRLDFPNSTVWELLKCSFLPPLPAALICGVTARYFIHRKKHVEKLEWSVFGISILGFVCSTTAIAITIVGATVLFVLAWIVDPLV